MAALAEARAAALSQQLDASHAALAQAQAEQRAAAAQAAEQARTLQNSLEAPHLLLSASRCGPCTVRFALLACSVSERQCLYWAAQAARMDALTRNLGAAEAAAAEAEAKAAAAEMAAQAAAPGEAAPAQAAAQQGDADLTAWLQTQVGGCLMPAATAKPNFIYVWLHAAAQHEAT